MKALLFNGNDIVLLVVIYNCVLFAGITLFTKRDLEWTHVWLALFLVTQAAASTFTLALYGDPFHHWVIENMPNLFLTLELSFWLEGPFLLLYTRYALYQNDSFKLNDWLLFFPVVIYMVIFMIVKSQYHSEVGVDFLLFIRSDDIQYYEHFRNLVRTGFGIAAFLTIKNYQKTINDAYSNVDQLSYAWLKVLVAGYIILKMWSEFYLILFTSVQMFWGEPGINQIDFDLMGLSANYGQLGLVSFLLYYGLSDSRHVPRLQKETFDSVKATSIVARSTYTDEHIQRLQNHMSKARPYLDSNLKIDDLAAQISIPVKSLSNLINREFGVNFFEYVNQYRVNEVKKNLSDTKLREISIIDLAFQSGYNSKTSFNRLFKIATGLTPSQYRQKVTNKAANR